MSTLEIPCYGITIKYDNENKAGAVLTSQMKEPETAENAFFNAAIDGIESMILAHFCAGVDVLERGYIKGIETAIESIANNVGERVVEGVDNAEQEDVVTVEKSRQIQCAADENIQYEVKRCDWEDAMGSFENEEEALFYLQTKLKATRVSCDVDVTEVDEEFGTTVIAFG